MNLCVGALVLMSGIILTFRIYAEGHTVHGCKDGQVRLNCRVGTILISDVFLADSNCVGSRCCPRQGDCRGAPSGDYRNSVLYSCNGKSSCVVGVEIRSIGCGIFGSNNDYTNISYECQVATTTTVASSLPLRVSPRVASVVESSLLSKRPTEADLQESESVKVTTVASSSSALDSESALLSTKQTEKEEELAAEDERSDSEDKAKQNKAEQRSGNEALKQTNEVNSYQHSDRMTVMTGLIVGGIVIVTTVISAAVVMALKKRRVPKPDRAYDLPEMRCTTVTDRPEENNRSSNFYDFIPDSGNCSNREDEEGEMVKENEYLKPMTEDEERPYVWIP